MATANLLQTSVSGGTQNALALQGDGVFFPKASTASRLALTLTTTDKGFVVYDTTDSNIYFWNGTAWESIPGSGDAGANGSVQYNDNGIVSGATNFVWDKVNGRVGIGTVTPGYPLSVAGRISYANGIGEGSDLTVSSSGVALQFGLGSSWQQQLWYLGGVEAARLNQSANFVLKGGTAGATGVGVTFPAVQVASSDANCLDDYEEGTWVPVPTAGVGAFTSVTGAVGTYTKIGRMVIATGFFTVTLNGTGSSFVAVAGLPFTVGSMNNVGVGRVDGTTGNMFQVKINAFTATANIWTYNNLYPAADGAQFPMTLVYYV